VSLSLTISAIVLASGVFLLGSIFRAAAGPSFQATLAITGGSSGIILSTIHFLSPTRSLDSQLLTHERKRMVSLFLFPALIWLVSAPMLATIESTLSLFLMNKITSAVFFLFDLLGLPIEQHGNTLTLPSGKVGVEEACSGIRSLTGCLFAGSFLAAVYLNRWWKKIALTLASLTLAVLSNLLRSLFLTGWSYRYGASAIEGTVHDVTGYAVLGLTVAGLFCVLPWLSRKRS
jgi:exosortase